MLWPTNPATKQPVHSRHTFPIADSWPLPTVLGPPSSSSLCRHMSLTRKGNSHRSLTERHAASSPVWTAFFIKLVFHLLNKLLEEKKSVIFVTLISSKSSGDTLALFWRARIYWFIMLIKTSSQTLLQKIKIPPPRSSSPASPLSLSWLACVFKAGEASQA